MSNAAERQRKMKTEAGSACLAVWPSQAQLARAISVAQWEGSQAGVSWRMRDAEASLWRRLAMQAGRDVVQEVQAGAKGFERSDVLDGVCVLGGPVLSTGEGLPPSLIMAFLKALLLHQQRRPYSLVHSGPSLQHSDGS